MCDVKNTIESSLRMRFELLQGTISEANASNVQLREAQDIHAKLINDLAESQVEVAKLNHCVEEGETCRLNDKKAAASALAQTVAIEEARASLQQMLKDCQTGLESERQANAGLAVENSKLKTDSLEHKLQCQKVENEKQTLKSELDRLTTQIEDQEQLQMQSADLSQRECQLQAMIATLQSRDEEVIQKHGATVALLKNEYDQALKLVQGHQADTYRSQVTQAKVAETRAVARLEEVSDKLEKCKITLDAANVENEIHRTTMESCQRNLSKTNEEVCSLRKLLSAESARVQQEVEAALTGVVNEHKIQTINSTKQHESVVHSLEQQLSVMKAAVEKLKANLDLQRIDEIRINDEAQTTQQRLEAQMGILQKPLTLVTEGLPVLTQSEDCERLTGNSVSSTGKPRPQHKPRRRVDRSTNTVIVVNSQPEEAIANRERRATVECDGQELQAISQSSIFGDLGVIDQSVIDQLDAFPAIPETQQVASRPEIPQTMQESMPCISQTQVDSQVQLESSSPVSILERSPTPPQSKQVSYEDVMGTFGHKSQAPLSEAQLPPAPQTPANQIISQQRQRAHNVRFQSPQVAEITESGPPVSHVRDAPVNNTILSSPSLHPRKMSGQTSHTDQDTRKRLAPTRGLDPLPLSKRHKIGMPAIHSDRSAPLTASPGQRICFTSEIRTSTVVTSSSQSNECSGFARPLRRKLVTRSPKTGASQAVSTALTDRTTNGSTQKKDNVNRRRRSSRQSKQAISQTFVKNVHN